jgi:dienelactone hydrolase
LIDARDFQETPESARRSLADLLRTPKQLAVAHNGPVGWRMPHLDVLGFLPRDREQLVLRTHGAYSMPQQHLVDLRTGDVREFGGDWPTPPGESLVFDSYRLKVVGERQDAARPLIAWRDDELGGAQRELEAKFPRRVVEILDWSETRARVLFRVTGGSDAGRLFVWQRPEDVVCEVLRRAPWLAAAKLNETRFLEFEAADGARLTGYVTWPSKPETGLPPVLIVFPSGFPGRPQPVFDPEAQVFADLGFVVVRLNHRSVAGVAAKDLTALRTAVDRVSIEDAQAAIEWIAAHNATRPFDRQRIATLGRGFGGYLALRAMQLQPELFRAGIAIDAPLDLHAWLQRSASPALGTTPPSPAVNDIPVALIDHAGTDWKKLAVLDHAEALAGPVLLLFEPGRSPAIDRSTAEFRARVTDLGRRVDIMELDSGFAAARPASRAAVYRRIEAFLNGTVSGSAAKNGSTEEVK